MVVESVLLDDWEGLASAESSLNLVDHNRRRRRRAQSSGAVEYLERNERQFMHNEGTNDLDAILPVVVKLSDDVVDDLDDAIEENPKDG